MSGLSMSFGGHRGDDGDRDRIMRMMQAPDNELPGGVGWSAMLARNADAAVGLVGLEAFSTGWRATLVTLTRTVMDPRDFQRTMMGRRFAGGSSGSVLLGVEYADGSRGSNVRDLPTDLREESAHVVTVMPGGGGGGGRRYSTSYWFAPLPPPGPVTIVCAWPDQRVEETKTTLDGQLLVDAAARAVELWPWEPPDATPAPTEPLDVPPGSWFFSGSSEA